MEQYEIPQRLCSSNIQKILQRFKPEYIYIRWRGSSGGEIVLNTTLSDKILTIKDTTEGFEFAMNAEKIFLFEFKKGLKDKSKLPWTWGKKWSIAYERITPNGVMHFAHSVNDPNLRTLFRRVFGSVPQTIAAAS